MIICLKKMIWFTKFKFRRNGIKLQLLFFALGLILFLRSKWFALFLLTIVMNTLNRRIYQMNCADGKDINANLYYSYTDDALRLMSNCILGSPGKQTVVDYPPLLENRLNEPYLELPKDQTYTDRVLILSPIRDAEHLLNIFAKSLNTLTYPHHLIRVAFAEDGSKDNTYNKAVEVSEVLKTEYGFKDSHTYKLPIKGNTVSHYNRHEDSVQIARRSHMAKARNLLTKFALRDEEWVFWIDIDIIKFRPDIIQQFLYSNKDVMVASVFTERFVLFSNALVYHLYERNSFNETVVDGKDYRLYPPDFKSFGREVPIQFVGSCMLMIRAESIRNGLIFPESVITSPGSLVRGIESEGLGMLARQMGYKVYALPFLEAVHY